MHSCINTSRHRFKSISCILSWQILHVSISQSECMSTDQQAESCNSVENETKEEIADLAEEKIGDE